jgi:conjugal transfer pilus assembly protein TraD
MSEDKKAEMTDRGFAIMALAVTVFVGWLKYKPEIMIFYVKWRFAIALFITVAIVATYLKLRNKFVSLFRAGDLENEILSPTEGEDSVFAGITPRGKSVFIKQSFRRMHTQVVGTTNAGKTESVIVPWAIDDIKKGRGLIIIDGKSDRSLLDKIYAYAKKYHRVQDVRILSLCNVDISHTFNPFTNGSVLEIAERVFAALNFENEYFKSIQYDAFLHCLLLLEEAKIKPTPCRVIDCLKSEKHLAGLANKSHSPKLKDWAKDFLCLKREEREQRTSGLVAQLQSFAVGETASIFNSEQSDIDLERALEDGEIIYCQLPALKVPTLGKATGKIILQCLQSAVSSRHLGRSGNKNFFSVYLDDFTEYLTPGFVTLLNKSRSANVGIVFAHQALGDLAGLGEGIQNTILTNSNLKVFMRTNEPESAEYFSSVIGTLQTRKITERQKDGFFGTAKTGDGSVREAEEFKFHPNVFKQELGVGEAVMVLPHSKGSLPVRIKFKKSSDLDPQTIPKLKKSEPLGMDLSASDRLKISKTDAGADLLAQDDEVHKETA